MRIPLKALPKFACLALAATALTACGLDASKTTSQRKGLFNGFTSNVTSQSNVTSVTGHLFLEATSFSVVTISWDPPAGAVAPVTYTLTQGATVLANQTFASGLNYAVNGLYGSTPYQFSLTAVDANGVFVVYPAVSITTPADPNGLTFQSKLTAKAATPVGAILTWQAQTDGTIDPATVGYTLYRKANTPFTVPSKPDQDGTVVAEVDGSTLTYVDTQTARQAYNYYVVCAHDNTVRRGCDAAGMVHYADDNMAPVLSNVYMSTRPDTGITATWVIADNLTPAANLLVTLQSGSTVDPRSAPGLTTLTNLVAPAVAAPPIPYQLSVSDEAGNRTSISFAMSAAGPFALFGVGRSDGLIAGGKTILLSGAGFSATTTAMIGRNACANFTYISQARATCVAPAGVAGTVDVTIDDIGGLTATLPQSYTYVVQSTNPCDLTANLATTFAAGSGTAIDPYIICNSGQFQNIETVTSASPAFRLMDNVDFANGNPAHQLNFSSSGALLDGNNLAVMNVTYVFSMFGNLLGMSIKNLSWLNININGAYLLNKGLVAENYDGGDVSTITGLYVQGTINGGLQNTGGAFGNANHCQDIEIIADVVINAAFNAGKLVGLGANLGFKNSHVSGPISGQERVGGLIGSIGVGDVTIDNSSSTGSIYINDTGAGGLIGNCSGTTNVTITNTYVTDHFTGLYETGGFIGSMACATFSVANSIYMGSITNSGTCGGIIAQDSGAGMITFTNVVANTDLMCVSNMGPIIGANDPSMKRVYNNVVANGLPQIVP